MISTLSAALELLFDLGPKVGDMLSEGNPLVTCVGRELVAMADESLALLGQD